MPDVGTSPFLRIKGQDLGVPFHARFDRVGLGGYAEEAGHPRQGGRIEGLTVEEEHLVTQQRGAQLGDRDLVHLGSQPDVRHLRSQDGRERDEFDGGHVQRIGPTVGSQVGRLPPSTPTRREFR